MRRATKARDRGMAEPCRRKRNEGGADAAAADSERISETGAAELYVPSGSLIPRFSISVFSRLKSFAPRRFSAA